MTTLAFDGTTLAADSLMVYSHSRKGETCLHCKKNTDETGSSIAKLRYYGDDPKPLYFKGSQVIAVAGYGSNITYGGLRSLLERQQLNDDSIQILRDFSVTPAEIVNAGMAVWTCDQFWDVYLNKGELDITAVNELPWEAGSGGYAALTAIQFMGLDAAKAVAVATHIDTYTGGDVLYVTRNGSTYDFGTLPVTEALIKELLPDEQRSLQT